MNNDFTPPYKAEQGSFSGEHDELVDCEMEAAQTLTCLAHDHVSNNDEFLAPGPSGCSEVKLNLLYKGGCSQPLNLVVGYELGVANGQVGSDRIWGGRKQEQVSAIQSKLETEPKTSPQHALNYPPVASRRSRQNLTEEEKEQRRVCRVLANRESARQTIRRRQAMYEELTRKAADLALENKNLKKQKELAAKEYDSLKNKNTSLRLQIAKIEAEAEETDGASKSKHVEISITSTAPAPAPNLTPAPTSLFNQSTMPPFFWPSIVQPFNSFLLQCSAQNISGITPVLPSPTTGESNSISRQPSLNPGNPLYVLPFPCMIPFNPQNILFLPQNSLPFPWSSILDKHAETSGVHQCSTSYLNMENNQAATAQECETDASDSVKATQSLQPSSSHIQTGTSGQSDTPHRQHSTPDINATVSCTAGQVGDTSEKTSQESITCSSDKSADAIAAAMEARKRRKELLHLKGHH